MIERATRFAAVRKSDGRALLMLGGGWALHLVTLWLTLTLPWWAALLAGVVNGIAIAQLFVMGHDACHLAFFSTHRMNRIGGRLLYLPTLTPFSIWHIIHNVKHHLHSNVRGLDGVWEPLDPKDYFALPGWRRALYRFYRSHPGVFAYYFMDYWLRQFIWPRARIVGEVKAIHRADVILCWSYAVALYGGVLAWAYSQGHSLWFTALASIILPHFIWNAIMSLTIYLQHTHPDIGWFNSLADWRAANGRLSTTAYVRIPRWMSIVSLEMMEHPAHHMMPGVPVYNLRKLNQALPKEAYPSWKFTLQEYRHVVRTCKLYDFEKRKWVGFQDVS